MSAIEIPAAAEAWVLLTLVALGLHLLAERLEWKALLAPTKLAASTGFLLVALRAGALESSWGLWIFVGLCLSWVGDACLLSRSRSTFLLGLVAFLLGHVAYCVAFVRYGISPGFAVLVGGPLALVAWGVDNWLHGWVEAGMRRPVRAYIIVITMMLTLAVGAWAAGAPTLVLLGALAFYLSDLSVARDRFVRRDFFNRLWGLPAYYLGQLCLALAVAA